MRSATIFYDKLKRFGVRFDTQILPQGSIVAGFLIWENGQIQELLDEPVCTPEQQKNLEFALLYSKETLQANGVTILEERASKELL